MSKKFVAVRVTVEGNVHTAAAKVNDLGWADYLISMQPTGRLTLCVFRMPTDKVKSLRAASAHYVETYRIGWVDNPDGSPVTREQKIAVEERHNRAIAKAMQPTNYDLDKLYPSRIDVARASQDGDDE